MKEQTLSIIKPDAVSNKVSGKIISMFEENGFEIIAFKKMLLTKKTAGEFYAIHRDKGFYTELVDFISSGPCIIMVLEKDDAVKENRKLMGATNPKEAEEGTIRKIFAKSIDANAVHGSDSIETATKEISFFFSESELISLK
jgi:nucleoside-diphosphate kinase